MLRYESLILTVPEITQDETKSLERELDRMAQAAKGSTISFERWGKYKLAYPIRKNDYGVYFLARFETPSGTSLLEDIKKFFTIKLNDVVMRDMVSRLDLDESLAYQRSKSLEESPATRDVSSFLKENKMEGLLSSVETPARKKAEQATKATAVQEPVQEPEAKTDDSQEQEISEVSDDKKD